MTEAAYSMTIDGAAVAGEATIDVINPATGQAFAQAPDCTRDQLDAAVAAARVAFESWRRVALADRREAVLRLGTAIHQNRDALAALLTAEQGKPLDGARRDVGSGASACRNHAAIPLDPEVIEDSAERRIEVRRVPIGVVAAIAPWNFPIALAMQKVAPALIAGNTVVLKPSPFTPLTTLKIGEIAREILPPGVLNVVSGGDALGPWLTEHPGIDKVTFTGSTATGRRVMASASDTLKRVTLELGGNDAAIVMPDVDAEVVAQQLFAAAFGNSGQICVAVKRLFIHADIYDRIAAALVRLAGEARIGDGSEQGVQFGPIQNAPQYRRLLDLIADAHAQGYRFLAGGEPVPGEGYFLPISIIDNPPDDARIVVEEQFGPILPLLKFTDVDDAVRRANATSFGLGGQVWAGDADVAADIAGRLETGTVWVNQMQSLYPNAPFGGHKQSGLGVELGREGLLAYTNPQTIVTARPAAKS